MERLSIGVGLDIPIRCALMFKEIGEFYGSVTINLNHPWRMRLPSE